MVIGDSDLSTLNTAENKTRVAPVTDIVPFNKKNAEYTFPKYSYPVITLKRWYNK